MTRLRIADLFADAPLDPEAHLDASRVERYSQMLDALPPVLVFNTPEGLLLADGYHRVAASRRLGLETVEAQVRAGSRHDALRYAARAGAAQRGISLGRPLGTSSDTLGTADPPITEYTSFAERRLGELRGITLPRTRVNRGEKRAEAATPRPSSST